MRRNAQDFEFLSHTSFVIFSYTYSFPYKAASSETFGCREKTTIKIILHIVLDDAILNDIIM